MTKSEPSSSPQLDNHGILAIIVFVLVSIVCIRPIYIALPKFVSDSLFRARRRLTGNAESDESAKYYLFLNHVWTPSFAIIFLLMTRTIGVQQLKIGFLGADGIEPYDILIFFASLSYIAISLDATGLLKYLALQVCLKAGNSGMRLFLLLYLFWWALGLLAGNDPVILSGTAFLVYLTGAAGIVPPNAWLWAQFVAANIASAILVTSNPTNLVIASGLEIEFTTYTAYMVLPSVASAATALGIILILFRRRSHAERAISFAWILRAVKGKPEGNAENPASTAQRRRDGRHRDEAIAMRNVGDASDESVELPSTWRKPPTEYIPKSITLADHHAHVVLADAQGAVFISTVMIGTLVTVIATNVMGKRRTFLTASAGAGVALLRDLVYDYYTWHWIRKEHQSVRTDENETGGNKALLAPLLKMKWKMQQIFPTVTYVLQRLPFALLPFAIGMFTLVESLHHVGFIGIMAGGFGQICSHGYVGCSFFHSMLGVIMCNLGGTNIGATILLTRSLQSYAFKQHLPEAEREVIMRAAAFSVAFGSNVGALGGTFGASLAGLLWRDDLRQRGVVVSKAQFAYWCAVVIVPATLSGILVLLPEVRYFGLNLSSKSDSVKI